MVDRPFVEKAPSILNKPDGTVLFECMVQANPPPTVHWYFKDQELKDDDRHVMKMKKMVGKYACTLQIKNPVASDQGIYKVVARNSHGEHSQEQGYVAKCTDSTMYKDYNA